MTGELEFYSTPGRMTDLAAISQHVDDLPASVPELCRIVQGLVLHPFWAQAYGVDGVAERDAELQLRPAADIVAHALAIDSRPLDQGRDPGQRVLGNCRDFTTVTTALLRHKGVPARGRCGFGTYFEAGEYIDHWVVEWWDGDRWVASDAQLDAFQVQWLKTDFDPLDVPHDRFIDAGRAWQLYRAGEADGDHFGVLDMRGSWFIVGNVARDLASLNKVEMLPWDVWGIDQLNAPRPEEEIDELAAAAATAHFDTVRELYATDDRVRVPDVVTSFTPAGPVEVRL